MSSATQNPALLVHRPSPQASARLVCFHHAAGAASIFREWASFFPSWIELAAVQLPGREQRLREPAHKDLLEAAREVAAAMSGLDDLPLFAFGHSLGATLAYECVRMVQSEGRARPLGLAVAASAPPHLRKARTWLHRLPDDELAAELAQFEGTPPAVLADKQLLSFFLPRIRADFEMLETYANTHSEPLECPLMILAGREDSTVGVADAAAWSGYSGAGSELHEFNGGHFFVHEQRERVTALLAGFVQRHMAGG